MDGAENHCARAADSSNIHGQQELRRTDISETCCETTRRWVWPLLIREVAVRPYEPIIWAVLIGNSPSVVICVKVNSGQRLVRRRDVDFLICRCFQDFPQPFGMRF